MTLALKAPARFKLNRSIRVPSVRYWARELDRRRRFGYYRDERAKQAEIADAVFQLDYAQFVEDYTAAHDCNPKISDKRATAWGERSAVVQVEDSIYRVRVSMGRFSRGMYGKNGHIWHLYVQRQGTDRRSVDGTRCGKSEGLGAAAVRSHIAGKFCQLRGIEEISR